MDKYIYLLLCLILFCIWSILFLIRKDLKRVILRVSLIGGLAGLLSEFWYFNDYWHPPSLMGNTRISLEDFLFGFTYTGIAAVIYKIIRGKRITHKINNHKKLFSLWFISGLVSLLIFNNLLKINSIFVSSFAFLLFSLLMVLKRKDLLFQSIWSGILSLIIIFPIYIFLFDFLATNYWNTYWLLSHTIFGIKIFGNIPMTELLWYFSWGCFAGIAYDYANGIAYD